METFHRDVTVRDIRFLRSDVAVLPADFETSGVTNAEGAAVPPMPGFYDWIVVKAAAGRSPAGTSRMNRSKSGGEVGPAADETPGLLGL